jgi:BirA family transcriptional regulator, biotin operon repressor / biotin---[acetyl-CoA-carboxylase] ligase
VAVTDDLTADVLAPLLPGRSVRTYPALLSSEVDAEAWARAGGPGGGVVTAGYLAAPRGRAGLPWPLNHGRGLVFSILLRPDLPVEREGWPYLGAGLGLADVLGPGVEIRWPDEVHGPDGRVGAIGLRTELGPDGVRWCVLTLLAEHATPPRGPLLAKIVTAVEGRLDEPVEALLDAYRQRCATLGRRVRARLVPLGPAGPQVEGEAVDVRPDGALVIRTEEGRRAVVPPPNLGMLEDLDELDLLS